MAKEVVVTQQGVEKLEEMEKRLKPVYGNYECPICHKYIWWDEKHEHKVGQLVRF